MAGKKYTQFSKRMTVVAVVAAVLISVLTEGALFVMGSSDGIVDVCKAMLMFAGLVFVAYCGNSAIEKWALSRYGASTTSNTDEEENG